LDQELAALVEEDVVLHLVREHRLVATIELELDAGGEHTLQLGDETALRVPPDLPRRRVEDDAALIDLDDRGPQLAEPGHQGLDEVPPFARDLVRRVVVVPVSLREGEVAV